MKKIYCIVCGKYRKSKNPKIPYIFKKTLLCSFVFALCVTVKMKRYLKKKNQLKY